MAIYHNEVKVITRGEGRSACAAAAYISCSTIRNDYDGIRHDYTRKGGMIWEQVFLPSNAPAAWQDREALWNAVEAAEKDKDSRLGRVHIVALPVEMDRQGWIDLLTDYIRTQFVDEGMCADAAIHDPDGHNPHAHIITTVRPLNEDGTWQYKTEKEYLCVRDGEERGFTAAEFSEAKNEGWEKQYPYKVGIKKIYMASSEAEARGYERASKYPKSTRFGRQNPIAARWNSEEQLLKWREAWAETVNRHMERNGCDERIDHRSHAVRGLEEQPTIHEGAAARKIEEQGGVAELCETNRQIRRDNALLRELKALVARLTESVKGAVTEMARQLETVRAAMIGFFYMMKNNDRRRDEAEAYLERMEPLYRQYTVIHESLEEKKAVYRRVQQEKEALPVLGVLKRRELAGQLEGMENEIIALRKKEKAMMRKCGKADPAGMEEIWKEIMRCHAVIWRAQRQVSELEEDISRSRKSFSDLIKQSKNADLGAILRERLAIRLMEEGKTKASLASRSGLPVDDEIFRKSLEEAEETLSRTDAVENPLQQQKPSRKAELENER